MTIRSFSEYNLQTQLFEAETAYNAGVEEAKKHYEEEAIAIMEYYDTKLRETSAGSIEEAKELDTKEEQSVSNEEEDNADAI